jgi:hypothetical protein
MKRICFWPRFETCTSRTEHGETECKCVSYCFVYVLYMELILVVVLLSIRVDVLLVKITIFAVNCLKCIESKITERQFLQH